MNDITLWEKRFWLEWKLDPESAKYNTPLVYELTGNPDINAMKKALHDFHNFYDETARMQFVEHDDGVKRKMLDHIETKLECINLQGASQTEVNACIEKFCGYVFDLSKVPLFKPALIQTDTDKFILILNYPHIISDGLAGHYLTSLFPALYNHYVAGAEKPSVPNASFEEYCEYERGMLTSGKYEENLNYWKNQLKSKKLYLDLPLKKRSGGKTPESETIYFSLSSEETASFRAMSKACRTSPFIFLSAVFGILLSKYSNEKKFAINYPVDMRPNGLKGLIGCLVNNLPLCFEISDNITVMDLIKNLTLQRKEAKKYQFCSLADIILKLRREKLLANGEFFNIGLVETYLGLAPLDLHGLQVKALPPKEEITMGEIELAYQITEQLKFRLNYRKDIFEPQLIQNFINLFKKILILCSQTANIKINELQLLSHAEHEQMVYEWNYTEAFYPKDKTIQQIFEEQAEKTPDNVAVVFENESLTYRELNEKANQLAHTILNEYKEHWNEEVKSDTFIGLYISPSSEMIIAMLAILKSGGAFVPFATAEPENRLIFKIRNCGSKLILTSSRDVEDLLFLVEEDILPFAIDSYWNEIKKAPKKAPTCINKPSDLAYVIYTSGSTGTPKGVTIEHSGVVDLIYNQREKLNLSSSSIVLQTASLSFDASIWEIFPALCTGAKLIVTPEHSRKDISGLVELLSCNNVSIATFTPAILASFPKIKLPHLKTIIVAGDTCDKNVMNYWSEGRTLINAYGPTEVTVCATLHYFNQDKDTNTNIGRPLNNKTLYVLDPNLSPVPIGVPGELFVGGNGLARGYLNRPELTKDRFVPNPFVSQKNKRKMYNLRLYKTGDIVRWLPNGTMEFIGRIDDQIKIRGFRIETGEIENKLSEHSAIKQCLVMCKERNGNKYLVAYYTTRASGDRLQATGHGLQASGYGLQASDNGVRASDYGLQATKNSPCSSVSVRVRPCQFVPASQTLISDLRDFLCEKLPDYMVPARFMELERMPLNPSGKIDRKALPSIQFNGNENNYLAPGNELEKLLVSIWQDFLKIDKIGINDDFFEIGGDSILSIQLVEQIRKAGYFIAVKDVFDHRTIKNISKVCRIQFPQKSDDKPYIEINPDMNTQPLFILPPAMHGPEAYLNNIVPILQPNKRLVLFHNFYADSCKKHGKNSSNLPTFEQVASEYVAIIKQIQPAGPYNLFGWSLGGALSLEIAKQLYAKGNKIQNLTICDTYFKIKDTISLIMQDKEDIYEKNMICKYDIDDILINHDANVNFLKATRVSESYDGIFPENQQVNEELLDYHKHLENYYVEDTHDNMLGDIMPHHNINVFPFNSSHYHWVECEESIDKICSVIACE